MVLEVSDLVVPTVVSYTHLPGSAKAGPGVVGSLGRAVGGPSPRVCCWSPTDKSDVVEWSGISVSKGPGSGSASWSSITMSSRGAAGVAAKQLNT